MDNGSRYRDGVFASHSHATSTTNNVIDGSNCIINHICNNNDGGDNEDTDDDLDAFLVALEKRCRSDFASCELSRSIQQQQQQQKQSSSSAFSSMITTSSNTSSQISSPADFMRKLRKVFPRAEKTVKLNCLIGMLGLDDDVTVSRRNTTTTISSSIGGMGLDSNSSGNKDGLNTMIDAQVYQLLSEAEDKDDEMWVRVIAGIVRIIMFRRRDEKEGSGTTAMTLETMENDNGGKIDDEANNRKGERRETESEKQLHKIVTEILRHGLEESIPNVTHQKGGSGGGSVGVDVDPLFVPMYYSLLSPATLSSILPEVACNDAAATSSFATAHFSPNMEASILNVDALAEDSRSHEEEKISEAIVEQQQQQHHNNGLGVGVVGKSSTGNGRGGGGRGPIPSEQSSALLVGRGGGRGRFANMAGREGRGGRGANNHGTSSSSSLFLRPASSAVGRGGLVAGRGRIDGRIGGRSSNMAVPGRSGSLSRLIGMGGRGRGAAAATADASARGGGGGGGGVKMLDASDVEGLHRAQAERESVAAGLSSVEARKIERKRKLMEEAAASGLKKSR